MRSRVFQAIVIQKSPDPAKRTGIPAKHCVEHLKNIYLQITRLGARLTLTVQHTLQGWNFTCRHVDVPIVIQVPHIDGQPALFVKASDNAPVYTRSAW